jgi:uroporphyrinogen-III synthase
VAKTPLGAVYTGNFLAAAFPSINRIGQTQLRLRFQLDDNDNNVADYLAFYSSNTTTAAFRPTLQILYYVP